MRFHSPPFRRPFVSICFLMLVGFFIAPLASAQTGTQPTTKRSTTAVTAEKTQHADSDVEETRWNGFRQSRFQVDGQSAYIVAPPKPLDGNPWVWRARFPGYHAEMDVELVKRGFHIGYVDVSGLFGSPAAMRIGENFYKVAVDQWGLSPQPAMEGVSRGGLFVYNWAALYPNRVSCIYCDTPVLDFKSWPGGKGTGLGSEGTWKQCLDVYGLTADEALVYRLNPVDRAMEIAASKIPILHIVSENDQVVPPAENTYLLQARLIEHGHDLAVISVAEGTEKSNGHHFQHPQPARVVEFVALHAVGTPSPKPKPDANHSDRMKLLRRAKTILFLGDSITMAGRYVSQFDAWLATQQLPKAPVVINVGLASETVSGLSEDGHAGGRFPRPHLAERLDRVLKLTQPDLVFACYGINCGIYQPFDQERFAAYQRGIRDLKSKVEAAGAELILVTPPSYDDARAKHDFSYNGVLDKYAAWQVSQRDQGWHVIDLHTVMTKALQEARESDPQFTFQPDAVHPNNAGHDFIAKQLIHWFAGDDVALVKDQELFDAVDERMRLLRDAYLYKAGHKRPGIRRGLPIAWAKDRASVFDEAIENRVSASQSD